MTDASVAILLLSGHDDTPAAAAARPSVRVHHAFFHPFLIPSSSSSSSSSSSCGNRSVCRSGSELLDVTEEMGHMARSVSYDAEPLALQKARFLAQWCGRWWNTSSHFACLGHEPDKFLSVSLVHHHQEGGTAQHRHPPPGRPCSTSECRSPPCELQLMLS
ncbi:hypothetical protein GW17_00024546 [Ensete ventricosum]|nr:hypothetical protein GW17_00024546 [Ensete ventricosum]